MHAAALAWVPPGFAVFDAGSVQAEEVSAGDAGPSADGEASVVETGETPADPPAGEGVLDQPVTGPADERPVGPESTGEEPGPDIAGPDGVMPPAPVNSHDAPSDPMAIPEFLRRVH